MHNKMVILTTSNTPTYAHMLVLTHVQSSQVTEKWHDRDDECDGIIGWNSRCASGTGFEEVKIHGHYLFQPILNEK